MNDKSLIDEQPLGGPFEEGLLATAGARLLTGHNMSEVDLLKAMSKLCAPGVDYADLYFQYSRGEAWDLREGSVKSASSFIDQGVGARAVSGDQTAFSFSQTLSPEALVRVAEASRGIAQTGGSSRVLVPQNFSCNPPPRLYGRVDPCQSIGAPAKVAILTKVEQFGLAMDPRVAEVSARLSGNFDMVLIARSDSALTADIRPLVRLTVEVTAVHGGRRETGFSGAGGRYDYSYFTDDVLAELARKAVDMALTGLDARPAPAGTMSVVLGPGVPGVLLHEAVGHGLEADFNRKGASAFAGRVGQQVAARGVTVIDDGSLPLRRGSLNVDDEGNPTRRNVLIEDGRLVGYMQDMLNARLMGASITGNARRASFAALPMPRMTNTYMASGTLDPREVVESVKQGLYVTSLNGGQVDITSGQFSMQASAAWLIEDGRVTAPVKGATLIGSGPDVLQKITLIGNNSELDSGIGNCGKDGQSIPVGLGQPTLRIDAMTVGGSL